MLAINLDALLYCAHAALPHLLKAAQDGSRLIADMVNVSSVAGRTVRRGSAEIQRLQEQRFATEQDD
jgi:NAD(P)-dependent dehydrogenase (short-subunit alcohol dehydrogenase family)